MNLPTPPARNASLEQPLESPSGTLLLSQGVITAVCDQAAGWLGRTPAEITGIALHSLAEWPDGTAFHKAIETPKGFELHFKNPSGKQRFFCQVTELTGGNLPLQVLRLSPLPEKTGREPLPESLLYGFSDLILWLDTDGRILEQRISAQVPESLGVHHALDKPIQEVFASNTAEKLLEAVRQALRLQQPVTLEVCFSHAQTGEAHCYETRLLPFGPERVVAALRDMTVRKKAEEALLASEALYRAVVEDQSELILRTGASGTLEFVNQAFCRYFGLAPEYILGTRLLSRASRSLRLTISQQLAPLRQGKTDMARFQLQTQTEEGHACWQEWSVRSIRDPESGDLIGFQAVGRDVTALKQIEIALRESKEQAEAATRAKSDFLATLSHEIRTPLNGVIAASSLMLNTPLTDEQREFAETIRSSGDNLMGLLNDILDFSKIESGNMQLEQSDFRLSNLLNSCMDIFLPKVQEKALVLEAIVDPNVPERINGDPTRLRQILLNLVSNAVKFTAKGHVRIRVHARDSVQQRVKLQFSVEDTGVGIPAEKMGKLFLPFTQVDSSTTRKYGGTGLGLAIAERLVKLMDGEIWAESVPGRGSTFHFTLLTRPSFKAIEMRSETETRLDQSLAAQYPLSILVVEDNPVNQRLMVQLLRKMGYQPDVVDNGWEAVRASEDRAYDCIFMDVQMPTLDGIAATHIIRQLYPEGKPFIVAMTASTMKEDRERCLAAGMQVYVPKPIRLAEVQDALRMAATFGQEGLQPNP